MIFVVFLFLSLFSLYGVDGTAYVIPPCNATAIRGSQTATFDWDSDEYQQPITCTGQGMVVDFNPCENVEQNTTEWGFFSSLEYNPSLSTIVQSQASFIMNFTQGTPIHNTPGQYIVRETSATINCIEDTAVPTCQITSNGANGVLLLQVSAPCPPTVSPSLAFPYLDISIGSTRIISNGRLVDPREVPTMHSDAEKIIIENTSSDMNVLISKPTVTLGTGASTEVAVTISGALQNGGAVRAGSSNQFTLTASCLDTSTTGGTFTVAFDVTSSTATFPAVSLRIMRTCSGSGEGEGMSTLSAFFLVLFIILLVGCVAGYMFKFSHKGMRGMEAVPFIDCLRSSWERVRDLLEQRKYTQDSVIAMEVRPKTSTYNTGYQDVAD